jgi:molybdate transport system substrate-binding protein
MGSRGPVVIVVLLAIVVVLGGVLVARSRGGGSAPAAPAPNKLVVFAPCGLSGPINIATARFRARRPDIRLDVVFDNANVLVNRVHAGEVGDVFMSPGEMEVRQLAEEGYILADSIKDWGSLDLVVIAAGGVKTLDRIEDLKSPSVRRVSMADPRTNSVGYYGQKALESYHLWQPLQTKLYLREAPLEAIKLVESGRADAGIAYFTCPLDTAPEKASKEAMRIVARIPRDKYPPVRLQAGLFKKANQPALGHVFIEFLSAPETQKELAANGVLPIVAAGAPGSASQPPSPPETAR